MHKRMAMTDINSNKRTQDISMRHGLLHLPASLRRAWLLGVVAAGAALLPLSHAADLTIGDGVVVKFGPDAQLVVRDKVTVGKGVAFTSQKDDTLAGQTNSTSQS